MHSIPAEYAVNISISNPPDARHNVALKPVFLVTDLEAVRAATELTNGYLKPAADAWEMGNEVVLDGSDPEGNIVQFRQPKRGATR